MSNFELKVGYPAPDFILKGSDSQKHQLSNYKGKRVILYFYPKDNTPGCTIEAEDFRDNIEILKDLNAVVLGVSRDPIASHNKFADKLCLPFILLSDESEEVCRLYDVLKEKNMYGKTVMGIERSTFIIDEEGILRKLFRKVKVDGHIDDIIAALKEMNTK